jgi:ADP-ribose pyrophosphatase YjhB (NUDIX family)
MPIKQVYAGYDHAATQAADRFRYCPLCRTALALQESGQRLRSTCPECGFIHFKNPAPTISILIVDGERVLLGRRRGDPGAGKWAIPAGYIEFEDDFLTTAIREAREETGLDVEIESIVNVVSSAYSPSFHFLSIYVLARALGDELVAADDLEAVDWFSLSGPLPEMAFQEDVDLIEWYATHPGEGLPIDPRHARGCRGC